MAIHPPVFTTNRHVPNDPAVPFIDLLCRNSLLEAHPSRKDTGAILPMPRITYVEISSRLKQFDVNTRPLEAATSAQNSRQAWPAAPNKRWDAGS